MSRDNFAFSPNLIAALEKVRGAKSQSDFVEEWLREHPQIAAELAAMNDPGFKPPVVLIISIHLMRKTRIIWQVEDLKSFLTILLLDRDIGRASEGR
jgi:hypothetical protein